MPKPIGFIEAFNTGMLRHVELVSVSASLEGSHVSPPSTMHWLIIGGTFYHVTGTDTILQLSDFKMTTGDVDDLATAEKNRIDAFKELSATASGIEPLFKNHAFAPTILHDRCSIFLQGDALATVDLWVLEW